jgi:hypothetical protein
MPLTMALLAAFIAAHDGAGSVLDDPGPLHTGTAALQLPLAWHVVVVAPTS